MRYIYACVCKWKILFVFQMLKDDLLELKWVATSHAVTVFSHICFVFPGNNTDISVAQ